MKIKRSTRTIAMAERLWLLIAAVIFCAVPSFAGQSTAAKPDSWSGVLVTSACNADEAFMESAECYKVVPGAETALYDDTNRVMYSLAPQDKVKGRLGDTVTVSRHTAGRHDSGGFVRADGDWIGSGAEGSRLFPARRIRQNANAGNAEGSERHGAAVFPFGGLVTLLQRAAGPAAKRNAKI